MSNKTCSRREFLERTSIVAAAAMLPGAAFAQTKSPNEKLNIGVIGVANRGGANLDGVSGENIVALCDVDDNYLADAVKRFPKAETYNDFRRMLDRKDLDAVVVSTPDHTHASPASMALQHDLHVYCEKPLCRTVYEVRRLRNLAKRHKRVTQMGTQIHAEPNYRRVVEIIQSGAIGEIKEAHSWVTGGYSGGALPTDKPPVPPNLHWDEWLGPVKPIAYSPKFAPFNWRGWWMFGNGMLGDFGCHYMDLVFWALDLKYPTHVEAEGPAVDPYCCPPALTVRYHYEARGDKPAVDLTWYHGDKVPPQVQSGEVPHWTAGNLFVGSKGMLLADYSHYILLPEKQFQGFVPPAKTIPDSIGHHAEWICACKTGGPTTCNFDYSGALSEAVLLGSVAFRVGKPLEWDAASLHATNCPEADQLLKPVYRRGWTL